MTDQKLKFKDGTLNLDALRTELSDIKKQLGQFKIYSGYESLKERVSRLEKQLAQTRKLKLA